MSKNTAFRPFTGFQWGNGTDLYQDKWSQQIVQETIKRYIGCDLSKVEIEGWIDTGGEKLQVNLVENGAIIRSYYFTGYVLGLVNIKVPNRSVFRKDMVGEIVADWLHRLGFPADYPRTEEVEITHGGSIQIEIQPAF